MSATVMEEWQKFWLQAVQESSGQAEVNISAPEDKTRIGITTKYK